MAEERQATVGKAGGVPSSRQADFSTLGGRLEWAIEAMPPAGRERGQSLFSKMLSKRDEALRPQGKRLPSSRPSINSYVTNKTEPPVTFIREAADILGVREEWLAFGSGPPTEYERLPFREWIQHPRTIQEHGERSAKALAEALEGVVWRGLADTVPGWSDLPHATRGAALRCFNQYRRLPHTLAEYGELPFQTHLEATSRRFGEYLATPFELLGPATRGRPVESALVLEALLRPIEVTWISIGEGGHDDDA